MSTPTPPPPELRADAARNRAKVLAVARKQLAAGDMALAMNVIARKAGVGIGTVYRHFPNRQSLLESLAMDSLQYLLSQARAAAEHDDPGVGLSDLMRAALRCLLDDVGLVAVLESPDAAYRKTSQLLLDLIEAMSHLLGRARAAGAIRPDIEGDDLRRYLCGLAHATGLGDQTAATVERDLQVLMTGLQRR